MSHSIVILFGAIITVVSYMIARSAKSNGYHFWRTWILSILGFTGILLLFLKLLG